MKPEPVITPNGTLFLTSETSILETNALNGKPLQVKAKVKSTTLKDTELSQTKWQPWGENDDFPNKLLSTIGQIGVLGAGLDLNSSMHYGNGIIWGRESFEGTVKVFKPEISPLWESLILKTDMEAVQSENVESLEIFYLSFAECIMDFEKSQIEVCKILDPAFTRLGKKNSEGEITHVYHHADIGSGKPVNDPAEIPIFDPKNPDKHQKFVIVSQYKTFGQYYYPEPIYYACIRNGYGDVAISIPKMLKYIFKNQMTIKYIIRVSIQAMKRKYVMWDTPPNCDTQEQTMAWQLARITELHDAINAHLTKEENAFKGLFTFTDGTDEGKGIEIEPIKSYLDTSSDLPTAAAANSEFLFSLLVDPSLVGLGIPGGKNLSGSGSDKRESRQIKIGSLKRERVISLKLPRMIGILSGQSPELKPFYMDTDTSQTLDENPTGSENIIQQ